MKLAFWAMESSENQEAALDKSIIDWISSDLDDSLLLSQSLTT